jgi:3-hydroxyisobutyrate dehydrogenase-like beta-hydroxyacid dehydrogenase
MVTRDFSGASFTASLRHKDAAYAVRLAETLLPGVPVSRAALAAYEAATASGPDDDEGKMIEIVSRAK